MAAAESHEFQADVGRLLDLMVHSVYSERDIFLRELVSNGADACEKLRYESLADPSRIAGNPDFLVTVGLDAHARTLSVTDNGIGMSKAELSQALGTIANSGTRAFLDSLQDDARVGTDLIGQFGIGFYSGFMVAERIDVESRRAGANEAHVWSSDGKGMFSVAPLALEAAPARGTRVILHLKAEASEYLEPARVEHILREHSSAIAVPIAIVEAIGKEPRRLTDGSALWSKPKGAVGAEEYNEFYRSLCSQFDTPALTLHWRAEGRHEYTVLAFVPGSPPFDLFDSSRKGRGKLYVRHVLVAEDAEILPSWLRFVRLVVDSADLPLNVSRELIQESAVFAAIKKGVANRVVQELTKLAENDAETYGKVWGNFGAVIKEGLYEEPERRDSLFKLARFATTSQFDGKRTLAEYAAAMRPDQTAIYYLAGDDLKRLNASPQLEGFRARGLEVLLLPDPIDAFWVASAVGYEGKPFKSVSQGVPDFQSIPLKEETQAPAEPPAAALATLFALMKQQLEDVASDVRASERLSESAACLVAEDHGLDRRLERMLAEHGQLKNVAKPVLEINPKHPLIATLAAQLAGPDKQALNDAIWLIFDAARLMDGEKLADPAGFAARLTRILGKAVGEPRGA